MKKLLTKIIFLACASLALAIPTQAETKIVDEIVYVKPVELYQTNVNTLNFDAEPKDLIIVERVEKSAPASSSGSCADWMSQAGIPLNHATQTLILNESGCDVYATNPVSGAYGIPQSLPAHKMTATDRDWET